MNVSAFIGTSVDGFIARANGGLDWLPPEGNPSYDAFIATVDAIIIGRKTYETVSAFDTWPYGGKLVVVLSTRLLRPAPHAVAVETMAGEPIEILKSLAARGLRHGYVDGGITIQRFLRAGCIQRLIITRVPVLIGSGVPLFGPLEQDIALKHVTTCHYSSGLVQSEYMVMSPPCGCGDCPLTTPSGVG